MMKTITIIWLAIFLLLLGSFSTTAQQTYQTREGIIEVIGSYQDSIVIASSDYLTVLLDYQTADITITLDPKTLHSTIDSFDLIPPNSALNPVTLKGKLNIPFVNTLQNPYQKLNFTAALQMNKIVNTIYANGLLQHIAGSDNFSSLLTLNFKFRLSDFRILLPEGWSDEITIQIIQAMLKKQ